MLKYANIFNCLGGFMKMAVVIGATGLVGKRLVEKLAADGAWAGVLAVVRRPTSWRHPKIRSISFDFENWQDLDLQVRSFSGMSSLDFFCCLGTTIGKAGSEENFKKVDYFSVVEFAKLAKNCKADQLLIVSALGANSHSSVFYNKTKGEMELEVQKTFPNKVYFARPSLLTGDREEFRLFERIAVLFAPIFSILLQGPLKKYRPISADAVAKALVEVASKRKSADLFIENQTLIELGK